MHFNFSFDAMNLGLCVKDPLKAQIENVCGGSNAREPQFLLSL
jgi:hypothetical protein